MSDNLKETEAMDEIDEAEEEALLKSDGDDDADEPMLIAPEGGVDEDNDDESDDDSDLEEDGRLLMEYVTTLGAISDNRRDYNSYLKLVETAHKLSDLDKIREAYRLFSDVFPLSPDIWLKYLAIESGISSSPEEFAKTDGLFQKALGDYYSTDVAYEYAHFVKSAKMALSEVWPELLGTYALHCMKGRQFFELFRKQNQSREDINDEEKRDAFVQSYLQELKIPLYDMEESYIEFKVFCEKNKELAIDWEEIDKDYNRAKTHLQRILPFEKQITDLDPKYHQERALSYQNYIKEADRFLNENVLQTIYERMVTECCLNADCWLKYISFLEYRDRHGRPEELSDYNVFQQTPLDVSLRSVRNCTWNEKMYIRRMHLMEKFEKSRKDVLEVLETGLSVGLPTPEAAVSLWMEYLSYLRRCTNYEDEAECEILRKNFDLCWNTLGQQWGVLADCNCEILQFWGRLEYGALKNQTKGRELWLTVMESSDNSTRSGLWIEFTQLEMRRDLESTRKLFKKALNAEGLDNPYVIASAWIRFERCNGTLKQLTLCQEQCQEFLTDFEYKARKQYDGADQKSKGKGTKRKSGEVENENEHKEKEFKKPFPKVDENGASSFKKTKFELRPATAGHSNLFKEHENEDIDLSKDHLRIFMSNLDYNITEQEIREELPDLQIANITLILAANGRSRGFGYAELVSEEEVEKALKCDRQSLKGRPVFISSVLRDKEKRQKFKYSDGLEPKKLFVKGLPYDVTKEELEDLFQQHGKLKDVRLVCHKSGKPKGIAYVEYESESPASIAILKLDQHDMRGHVINIAISAPPPKAATKEPLDMNKLLGVGPKKRGADRTIKTDQRPRMSLIPSSVRKQLSGAPPTSASAASAPVAKSNADFRKLLEK